MKRIADRIDCVIDTDDHAPDLASLCREMGITLDEYPELPTKNVAMYKKLFEIPHIIDVLNLTFRVTTVLRDHLMKRRCRFLGNRLVTPHAESPQWPYKDCNIFSKLEQDFGDDAPENDPETDDAIKFDDTPDDSDNSKNDAPIMSSRSADATRAIASSV